MTTLDPAYARYLARVPLHEYTAGVARERTSHDLVDPRTCGALPAPGFIGWCWRRTGHDGDHSAVPKTATRMDKKDQQ